MSAIQKGGRLYIVTWTDESAPVLETWVITSIMRKPRPRYSVWNDNRKPTGDKTVYLRMVVPKKDRWWKVPPKYDFPVSWWPKLCRYTATPAAAWRKALPGIREDVKRTEKYAAESKAEGADAEEMKEWSSSLRQLRSNRTRIEKRITGAKNV